MRREGNVWMVRRVARYEAPENTTADHGVCP